MLDTDKREPRVVCMKNYTKACVGEDYQRNIEILIHIREFPSDINRNMKMFLQKFYVLESVWLLWKSFIIIRSTEKTWKRMI
jgi:hypothetical protein